MSALVWQDGKRIGSVDHGVFKKTVHASRHFLRKPEPAIALSLESLKRAEDLGALFVQVYDAESHVTYSAAISHIRARGFEVDRGFGKQLALPLAGWAKSTKGGATIPQQLTLFGGGQ